MLKFKLYVVSLILLFGLLFLNRITFPTCFGSNCSFVGWKGVYQIALDNKIPMFCIGMILIGLFFYRQFKYRVIESSSSNPEIITEIENLNFENLTFFATYIVPLLCFDLDFDLTLNRNFMMLLLVLFLIGWIYIKTNIFYTNPTLAIWNFNLYKITTNSGKKMTAIVKGKLAENDTIQFTHIDDNIFFVKKVTAND